MTTQRTLFPLTYTLHPRDPNIDVQDVPRVAGQNAALLARLQRGPATNDELIRISRKYTSRISDLRAAGYTIVCERLNGGLTEYTLTTRTAARTPDPIRHMT
jgi:hypothetical protein